MALPAPLAALLRDHHEALLGVLLLTTFLLLIAFLLMIARISRLNRLYARLTRGTSGGNLEEILHEFMGTVTDVSRRMAALETAAARLDERQQGCLQRVGIVRFDAFEDVGGKQSFAVAMLDAQRNGIVLSSVYSRSDVRVYAKAIHDGQPSHPLSREEAQAMERAEGK